MANKDSNQVTLDADNTAKLLITLTPGMTVDIVALSTNDAPIEVGNNGQDDLAVGEGHELNAGTSVPAVGYLDTADGKGRKIFAVAASTPQKVSYFVIER